MDRLTLAIVVCFLAFLGAFAARSMLADLRSGTSGMVHEQARYTREDLPLNYWLAVGSKALAVGLAVVLGYLALTM